MLRVTLAARLALIGLVGITLVTIVVVAIFYRTTLRENELTRPSPARLDALATLLERTAAGSRQAVLDAVSSPQFTVRIVPSGAAGRRRDAAGAAGTARDLCGRPCGPPR